VEEEGKRGAMDTQQLVEMMAGLLGRRRLR